MHEVDVFIYDNVEDFYINYVKLLHQLAKDLRLANNGEIKIPDLRFLGIQAICGMLDNPDLRALSRKNIQKFNWTSPAMATAMGVTFSQRWKQDRDTLVNGQTVISYDILKEALEILKRQYNLNGDQIDFLFNGLPYIWANMVVPYQEREDYPKYTVASLLANFQLAMSIVLQDYKE